MSSAMNSNPASVGSGGCPPRDEAPLRTLLLVVDPPSIEAQAVAIRTDLKRRLRPSVAQECADGVDRDKPLWPLYVDTGRSTGPGQILRASLSLLGDESLD
jgi:hypothetical protein